jgi:hypothetical protein
MISNTNCCYQCKDRFVKKQEDGRTISCHSTCEKYIAYRKELDLCQKLGYSKASDYARAAIVDLAVALCRKAAKSNVKKQAYKLAKKQISEIAFKTLISKNVPLKTKAKTCIGVFSMGLAVKFCNIMGEKS